jgi:hypothetical protein
MEVFSVDVILCQNCSLCTHSRDVNYGKFEISKYKIDVKAGSAVVYYFVIQNLLHLSKKELWNVPLKNHASIQIYIICFLKLWNYACCGEIKPHSKSFIKMNSAVTSGLFSWNVILRIGGK